MFLLFFALKGQYSGITKGLCQRGRTAEFAQGLLRVLFNYPGAVYLKMYGP
jgi:hypothetical protein